MSARISSFETGAPWTRSSWNFESLISTSQSDDHHHAAPVRLDQHRNCARGVDHPSESRLRLARRLGFHRRISWPYIAPLRAEWLSSPSCFGCGREGSSGRISGAAGTVLRRQDKSGSPFGRFAVVGQWVTACRRKGGSAAFPEKLMESMRIAPPMAVLGVSGGGVSGRQGKSLAVRRAYVVGII